MTEKTRLGESCINLVHKKEKKEEVKESNTIHSSEDNENVSTLNLLDTSNTVDEQTLMNSYDELPSNLVVLNDMKIGLNENVNLPISIKPNASVDFGVKFLQKMSSNIHLTSSGRLHEPTYLDSIEIEFDSNPINFQKRIGLYLNNSPGQRMGLTIVSDSQGENQFGIPMTEDLANAFYSIKAEYSGSNRDSTPDRDLNPIKGGVNEISNTIARYIIPELKNNTEKGKVSDNVKITNLSGRIGQGTPLNNPFASKTGSAPNANVRPSTPGQLPRSPNSPANKGQSARQTASSATGEGFGNNRREVKLSRKQPLPSNKLKGIKLEDERKRESFVTRAYAHRESQSVQSLSEFFSQEASQD